MATLDQKLSLYFVMHHAPTFANFFGPVGYGRFCQVRFYQQPAMLSDGGVLRGGRRWGKTFILIFEIIRTALTRPGRQQLLAVFRRPHRANIFEELIKMMGNVRFFKSYYLTGKEYGSVKRDEEHEIRYKGGHSFYAIAVGEDPHAAMILGKSPCKKYVDEAQTFPTKAAAVLSSTVDPEGCEEYWAGVVDGRRDTAFFRIIERSPRYTKKIYKFSRRLDPNFCQDDLQKAIEDFAGGERSDKFGQEVDAEHGNPTAGVWNIDDLIACIVENKPGDVNPRIMREIVITPRDFIIGDDPTSIFRTLNRSDAEVIIGIDVGDVEPTMVLPFIKEDNKWTLKNKIEIRDRVDTVTQVELLYYIYKQFPGCVGIGIDITNSPAIADVLSSKDTGLKEKIVRVRFNANVPTGFEHISDEFQVLKYYKEEGKRVKLGDNVPLTQKTKNFSTERVRQHLNRGELLFYHQLNLVEEFTSETAAVNASGVVIATPRDVHMPEAIRCAAMAIWEKQGGARGIYREEYERILPEAVSTGFFGRDTMEGAVDAESFKEYYEHYR